MTPLPRFLILAEGHFGPKSSKTANSCIRYTPERVAAVLDSTSAGRTVADVLGFGGAIPIVSTFEEGLALAPTALLIGIAPQGGQLPASWRAALRRAIESGLELWSGLHFFIGDDPELAALAAARGVAIRDLRRPPAGIPVATGRVREVASTVVLAVGTDCNIGKMTAQLQLRDALRARGSRVAFAATGQTGILIEGWGTSVDAVVADFIAGAAEQLVLRAARDGDIVLVEGQGSIIHPGYSGVTYGLMHGSLPHAMIICAQPSRTHINNNPWVRIPPLPELIRMHERAVAPLRPAPVIGVSLHTGDLAEEEARRWVERVAAETGLPTTDPVRFDPAPLAEAV
ncbi:MAG TPA: DUF1611 domain-containing protein, partial [Gemmatimonadaceae bacterium]|nr:DUF1611 domain-containing protein [Gemmatimonadaceae bacterium]